MDIHDLHLLSGIAGAFFVVLTHVLGVLKFNYAKRIFWHKIFSK
ncbi:MAG: hypothetical protein ABDH23_05590 [Endomicrobiia bacterium]